MEKNDWHLIEFFTPISEHKVQDNDFIIRGVAINETTTHNNHKYIAEELEKAAPMLVGKKLLVDHRNEVEAIKGVITESNWNPKERRIDFAAKVMDKTMQEMIKDGRVSDVSWGVFATDLIKDEKDNSYIAKGIKPAEVSLVAVPADSKANFAMAMASNFTLKESINSLENERRLVNMTEEITEMSKLQEEVKALKSERRQNLISEYKRLCTEKKVKETNVSNASDESIKLLSEQISMIESHLNSEPRDGNSEGGMDEPDGEDAHHRNKNKVSPRHGKSADDADGETSDISNMDGHLKGHNAKDKAMKSVITTDSASNLIVENSSNGLSIWEMPSYDNYRKFHSARRTW